MSIIADIIVVAILIACIFAGYRRGLAGSLIRILAFAIAVCVAFVFFKPVSNIIIDNTNFDENIQTSIVEKFDREEKTDKKEEGTSPILEHINQEVQKATEEKKQEVVNDTSRKIAVNIINILAFIGLFILARIAVMFIKSLTNLITKLPLIKQCDKIGGVIYGIAQGLLIIFLALAITTFISTISNNYEVMNVINNSYIASKLNANNILLNIIL